MDQNSQSSQQLNMSQFSSSCVDPSDLNTMFDFNNLNSPAIGNGKGRMLPQATSAITSPSILSHDLTEDQISMLRPSHDYGRFKQQTGLPTQATYLHMSGPSSSQNVFAGYNTGLYDSQSWDGMGSQTGLDGMDAFIDLDDGVIDPESLMKQEEAQANIRYFPGMHQQQALEAKQKQEMERQRQQQRVQQAGRRSGSSQPLDARTEQTIARVMSDIRRSSNLAADQMSPTNGMLPHVIRAKKDEDDMDEDERLLNSEEGKKLTSKERRQLRNKVSARAFRSRRKEYIGQLESELAGKANEAAEFQRQNTLLIEENQRFRSLAERLLSHPAFHPFLEELSQDPNLADSLMKLGNPTQMQSTPQIPKNIDPFNNSAQFVPPPQANNPQVGMSMMPEMPVDLSSLNIGNNWGQQSHGMPVYQPQVFAVTELPQGPVEPIDINALSGKSDCVLADFDQTEESDEKALCPEVEEAPVSKDTVAVEQSNASIEEVESASVFDEKDPTVTLFATSARKSTTNATSTPTTFEPIFGNIAAEKVFERFEIFVPTEQESQRMQSEFERMCARLEADCRHLDELMAGY